MVNCESSFHIIVLVLFTLTDPNILLRFFTFSWSYLAMIKLWCTTSDVLSRSQQGRTPSSGRFLIQSEWTSSSQHGTDGLTIVNASFSITPCMSWDLVWRIARHVNVSFHLLTILHEYSASQRSFTEHRVLILFYGTGTQPSTQTSVRGYSDCDTCANTIISQLLSSELQTSAPNP